MKTDRKKRSAPTSTAPEKLTVKPRLKWQTGAFQRDANFRFFLPYQFLLLCKLTETSPETMLHDFMQHLACGSPGTISSEPAKQTLMEYFVQLGYGQGRYSAAEIRQMFRELDAIGMLFPKDAPEKMLATHSHWREQYQRYWFRKWRKRSASPEKKD